MQPEIKIYVGSNARQYIDLVSQLRITAFKEYPYLYEGNLDYEREYMGGYTADMQAMITIATLDGKIVGVATGIPLVSNSDIVKDAKATFETHHLNPQDYYYYGEVIVMPEYKGNGLAKKLFDAQDEKIKEWGYKHTCILTVMRDENHPQKPIGYKLTDSVWAKMGFFKMALKANYHWPTIKPDQSVVECEHEMQFWQKNLTNS